MKGLAIAHTADELDVGQEYVTTLRDREVLDEDSEDELENAQLQMTFKQKQVNKNKERIRQHRNKGFVHDENEWAEPDDESDKILSKYDDIGSQAIEKRKARRMRVGQDKIFETNPEKEAVEASKSIEAKIKISSDYYTKEEDPLQGSKIFKKKKKELIGKKRKREQEDEEDIIATLEQNATEQFQTRGQRKEAMDQERQQTADEELKKKNNFPRAFDRIKNRKGK